VWWKGGLAQGAASVMVDWNMKTFSVVDGLAQRAARVMVHVCALRIQEAIPFSWEKKEYISDKDAGVEAKLASCCNCTTSCAEFIIMDLIIGVGWWDCMLRNVTVHNCLRW